MKGNFNELEPALLSQRARESLDAMAQRGQLFVQLPAGYEKGGRGTIVNELRSVR